MNITVIGAGYVGLANSIYLAQENPVTIIDINPEKIEKINNRISPISDKECSDYLKNKDLNLSATFSNDDILKNSDYIFISTPTNYDENQRGFNTKGIEEIIENIISINPIANIIIKSTVPVGFTKQLSKKFNTNNIFFVPEFLREGKALKDTLEPTRIIVGYTSTDEDTKKKAKEILTLLSQNISDEVPKLLINSSEAEAVKLFSNTYLAMRIGFINELDTFAELNNLSSENIINGISADPRIGDYYNNPSFGYGGYCLPKDSKQLLSNFDGIPQELIESIVKSNETRIDHISNQIIKKKPRKVGIYQLEMKKGSDNFRESSIYYVLDNLKKNNIDLIIYEPKYSKELFEKIPVTTDLEKFKEECDLILTNRYYSELDDVKDKVYTRDIYNRD